MTVASSAVKYEAHFGFELPFWLALPEGEYGVVMKGVSQKLRLSNSVDRLEVGDFYLGKGVLGTTWCHRNDAEARRVERQKQNPEMPVTRRPLKTVITHGREVEAAGYDALQSLYKTNKIAWYDESLELVNRLVETYLVAVGDDGLRGQAGRVASWDVGLLIVSFWEPSTMTQVGGFVEYVREETPAPPPIPGEAVSRLRDILTDERELPLPPLLHAGAASHIVRGNYRAAIVDDVTALEISVENEFRRLSRNRVPETIIDSLLRPGRFEELFRKWLPAVGGQRMAWSDVNKARDLRHKIVHAGVSATQEDARRVHQTCVAVSERLAGGETTR